MRQNQNSKLFSTEIIGQNSKVTHRTMRYGECSAGIMLANIKKLLNYDVLYICLYRCVKKGCLYYDSFEARQATANKHLVRQERSHIFTTNFEMRQIPTICKYGIIWFHFYVCLMMANRVDGAVVVVIVLYTCWGHREALFI